MHKRALKQATADFLRWVYGIKSPSEEMRQKGEKFIVKPMHKGIKQGAKAKKKYISIRKKYEKKWYKHQRQWKDTRQKKKAFWKDFSKEYPQYGLYIAFDKWGKVK